VTEAEHGLDVDVRVDATVLQQEEDPPEAGLDLRSFEGEIEADRLLTVILCNEAHAIFVTVHDNREGRVQRMPS